MPTADELLGPEALEELIGCLERSTSRPMNALQQVEIDGLGLSDRTRAIRDALLVDLPGTAHRLNAAFRKASRDPRFTGWLIWPVTEAVAARAVQSSSAGDFEDGLALLAELTPRLTSEFAIRAFLNADLGRTLAVVRTWPDDPDSAVRRLASEGTRPRLPWAKRVPALLVEPGMTVPVLERLYRDESEFVRRSVANHLNDISRIDADLAVQTATRWLTGASADTRRLVGHSMRSLIKQGHEGALTLMGFAGIDGLSITGPLLDRCMVAVGGELEFSFVVRGTNSEPVRLAIDYVVHFVKANGRTAPKVFKLTTKTLAPGQSLSITKRQSFRPISTRVHYPGTHRVDVQINGRPYGTASFELVAASGRASTQSPQ